MCLSTMYSCVIFSDFFSCHTIGLNQKKAAKRLIQTVTTKNLTKSKLSLLKQAVKQKLETSTPKKEVKQKPESLKTGFRFPTDEHIFRMRSVSQRLQEEKLLSELKLDVLKARLDDIKSTNQGLIQSTKDMTVLTTKGAENLEKSLESLKEKDLKI